MESKNKHSEKDLASHDMAQAEDITDPTNAPFMPPLPTDRHVNPIKNTADWERMREACIADPGAFHGNIAAETIHWYNPARDWWLIQEKPGLWHGIDHTTGEAVTLNEDWQPWIYALDDSEAPFYRWFSGAQTNACFNEVDRHVFLGHGDEIAYWFEGDRWDQAANEGRGGPTVSYQITRNDLLIDVVIAAQALLDLGLKKGDRIALNMPNIPEQIIWTEAAKRIGVIYTAVFGGFSDKTLSDRIHDAGAKIVITADGAVRNAEIVPFKEAYCDPALDRFISVGTALTILQDLCAKWDDHHVPIVIRDALVNGTAEALTGEITITPADVMRTIGTILDESHLTPPIIAAIRADLAEALSDTPPRVEKVIVVNHVGLQDLAWNDHRDVWAEDLLAHAAKKICQNAGIAHIDVMRAMRGYSLIQKLWKSVPPLPLEADFPMFIIYTSGSTGKPKGVVHVHGGYVSGIAHSMKISFDADPERDRILVIADPGWITGQSYLITASLAARIPGVIMEGSPVFPHAGRFSSIIERYKITIFKAGVTFLKSVMANPQNRADAEVYDMSSLRVATFCAEPTSPSVQRFGMDLMTPQYINSYWATEHGGIVWTHFYGNPDFPLRADARTWPLPWVMGDVYVTEGEPDQFGRTLYRLAEFEEQGEIVITMPYPYLARTIWGDGDRVGREGWQGDFDRFFETYYGRFRDEYGDPVLAYVQGDFARCYEDGSFSLHGRSDDVINVSGHRMGTEEIEGAVLRDKQLNPDSPVGNCIVIGAPHRDKGQTPVAFILPAKGKQIHPDDERRLTDLVRTEKGAVAVPSDFISLSAFPETRSGKYMRRLLSNLMNDHEIGDISTLRNPDCMEDIRRHIDDWKRKQHRADSQTILEKTRFLEIHFDTVSIDLNGADIRVATVIVHNPPVNALSERVLDELDTQLRHLERREDIGAIVITGKGNKTFIAGADIRQLLEDIQTTEEALSLPTKAHATFSLIERMKKPVIAAVQGLALGGGCELAMACHYRIGDEQTRMGQPEINLFLPPGYGGTQRLPRLLLDKADMEEDHKVETSVCSQKHGLVAALGILISGRQIQSEDALALGLLDEIVYGSVDALTRAWTLARIAAVTGLGLAIDAMRARHDALSHWQKPRAFDLEAALADDHVAHCCWQSEVEGRAKVAREIIQLVTKGLTEGYEAGLLEEQKAFSKFILDSKNGGRKGIQLFLEKKSPHLPARWRPDFTQDVIEDLEKSEQLLPIGAPFHPGLQKCPTWQRAMAVTKDRKTGLPNHGNPINRESEEIIRVPQPGPNQALVYVLASEINYNDIWAITGIPISMFDEHDEDIHVTGSGGIGLVVALGEALQNEKRLSIGSIVAIYSGVSDLLNPEAGVDPMFTDFHIQGYQSPDGSHQQFMLCDGPQLFTPPQGLTLEAAGSYMLAAGTAYRALFTALKVRPGKGLFVEGAVSGTGSWAVEMGLATRMRVAGLVSSPERKKTLEARGRAGRVTAIDRHDPTIKDIFHPVPLLHIAEWEKQGEPFLDMVRTANGGALCDYAVSHAGETAFPRSFQALSPGGSIAFFGASSGFTMTFVGKEGTAEPQDMFHRAALKPGEAVLVFYGQAATDKTDPSPRDDDALLAIEAAREAGARIVVITDTNAERDFILSLGFGDAVLGALSLSDLKRRIPHFEWPNHMPELPDSARETAAFKDAVQKMNENMFKPLGTEVGRLLRSADNPKGVPDVIVERAHTDSLALSSMMVRPFTGRVLYCGDMQGRRYSFYAPQVWMRQRKILMPTATIIGTHLCNAAEIASLNRLIEAGSLHVDPPYLGAWETLPALHQAMWENRLPEATGGAFKSVINHALPEVGLKTKEELQASWAAQRTKIKA